MIDAETLAHLPDDARITITVEVRALKHAIEMVKGGKQVLSTRDAARELGWSEADWRRWAPDLPGAVRAGKRWRFPRDSAEKKVRELMKRDGEKSTTAGQRRGGNYGKFDSKATSGAGAKVIPFAGRADRG